MEKTGSRRPRAPKSPERVRTARADRRPVPEDLLIVPARPPDTAATSVDFAQFLTPTPRAAKPKTAKKTSAAKRGAAKKPAGTSPAKTRKTAASPAKPKRSRRAARAGSPPPVIEAAAPPRPAKQRGHPVETPPVIALPDRSEPLVIASPAPVAPLPRSRALALPSPVGLFALLAHWLDASGRRVDRFLARRRKAAKARLVAAPPPAPAPAPTPAPAVTEVDRLRAENEALKRQLEALQAVQRATAP